MPSDYVDPDRFILAFLETFQRPATRESASSRGDGCS